MALLAYLAVTSAPQSRDALATLLWPDKDESQAHAYLRVVLFKLKQALGAQHIAIGREHISLPSSSDLSSDFWFDVAHFRRSLVSCTTHGHAPHDVCLMCLPVLAEAVALYRADFMAGFTLPDSPEFDEWQFFQTESLRRDLASALERLVSGHSAQGELESAIAYARRWVALDQLHEPPAWRCLMDLYAQAGQRPAALRQYEECQRLLATEVGGLPEQETTALYEAIKARKIGEAACGRRNGCRLLASIPDPRFPCRPSSPLPLHRPARLPPSWRANRSWPS